MNASTPITVAYGDGIGPEIMEAALTALKEAGAKLEIETIEVGERIYNMGAVSGILPSAWESLRRTQLLLKAPTTLPPGEGYKSVSATLRETLGHYATICPLQSYHPFIHTSHPKTDRVMISGSEHERVVRYAFDYALQHHRKKITCLDEAFRGAFDDIGQEYPTIQQEYSPIDKPEILDIILAEHPHDGDISNICGSVGMAASSHIGAGFSMFEPTHGSAPGLAGKNLANPSAMLHSAVMLLLHIGQSDIAAKLHNAWLRTIEDGLHTADIYREGVSSEKLGTREFTDAVIDRLGKKPSTLAVVGYHG